MDQGVQQKVVLLLAGAKRLNKELRQEELESKLQRRRIPDHNLNRLLRKWTMMKKSVSS